VHVARRDGCRTSIDGNVIDFNQGVGVQIGNTGSSDAGTRHKSLLSNSIYLNGSPVPVAGIQISNGANEGVAAPKLPLTPLASSSALLVTLMIHETTPGPYQVQVFASGNCSAQGQGQTLVGPTQTETRNGTFLLKLGPAPAGQKSITATVTDANHNTSAFSNCMAAK
jgi:hypothetical protein